MGGTASKVQGACRRLCVPAAHENQNASLCKYLHKLKNQNLKIRGECHT